MKLYMNIDYITQSVILILLIINIALYIQNLRKKPLSVLGKIILTLFLTINIYNVILSIFDDLKFYETCDALQCVSYLIFAFISFAISIPLLVTNILIYSSRKIYVSWYVFTPLLLLFLVYLYSLF